ncbi:hypothetical protein [Actinoplanes teichomyceticus]|uniref:Uncharacterized protein n=1 Tax=Actinoplanes teichomyceticus TaxID=1867 RepID=A0A561VLW5_ACTTI|nr:hypothetical protein [Actinoplanes teichomyceticus]TWG12615.1 hypothetical protein FHX34_105482 [Actinoplanes teichomyceticus]GIF13985.1 hypothetical protein Ate01nite_40170 [Actinoplanes teichomyceticus]
MTETRKDERPAGLAIGSMIALAFGTVFVVVNSGELPEPWPVSIRVAGVLVAVGLAAWLLRVTRSGVATRQTGAGFGDRRYWYVVAAEVIVLFAGLNVITRVLHAPEAAVGWVAVVVGLHFNALAWAWRMPLFHRLGAVMTALGVAGFVAYALNASAATIGLIAGVGSGVALFVTVAVALRDVRRG